MTASTKTAFNKGKWVAHAGHVTSDSSDAIFLSGAKGAQAVDYYGGNLICESASKANARLIAAAPEMYNLLGSIDFEDGMIENALGSDFKERLEELLAKARGDL